MLREAIELGYMLLYTLYRYYPELKHSSYEDYFHYQKPDLFGNDAPMRTSIYTTISAFTFQRLRKNNSERIISETYYKIKSTERKRTHSW